MSMCQRLGLSMAIRGRNTCPIPPEAPATTAIESVICSSAQSIIVVAYQL